jgi:hypothetical protein
VYVSNWCCSALLIRACAAPATCTHGPCFEKGAAFSSDLKLDDQLTMQQIHQGVNFVHSNANH